MQKSLGPLLHKVIGTSSTEILNRIILLSALFFLCLGIATLNGILYGTYYSIASIDLSSDYTLKLWTEERGILAENWDPDHAYPNIYYQIEKKGDIAVRQTYLTTDIHYTYDIKVVFAEQGQLACVYDTKLWTEGLYIIWDVASGESWPRLRDNEVSYRPSVQQKWSERYTKLKLENPTLPEFGAILN